MTRNVAIGYDTNCVATVSRSDDWDLTAVVISHQPSHVAEQCLSSTTDEAGITGGGCLYHVLHDLGRSP